MRRRGARSIDKTHWRYAPGVRRAAAERPFRKHPTAPRRQAPGRPGSPAELPSVVSGQWSVDSARPKSHFVTCFRYSPGSEAVARHYSRQWSPGSLCPAQQCTLSAVMNERHLQLCASAEWADTVQREILPWALGGRDLGDDVL